VAAAAARASRGILVIGMKAMLALMLWVDKELF